MSSYFRLTAILIFAVAVFEASTNIFLPSLCIIQDFHHTTPAHTQFTVSAYLLGFGILGLLGGPLSDSIGRRPVMLLGLSLFWIGSLFSMVYAKESLDILIIARFIQGLGAGTATILIMVIIKDFFDEMTCARILSLMGMVIAVAPMIAPMLGGAIADYYAWESNFVIMFIAATITLLFYIKEGQESHFKRKPFHLNKVKGIYLRLLGHKKCLFYSLISMLLYGSLFAWIIHAPFYFQENFNLTNFSYAILTALGPVMYILGSFVNFILLPRFGITVLTRYGLYTVIAATLFLLTTSLFTTQSFWLYIIGFLIFSTGMAPIFANAATKALEGENKGAASAMLACLEQSFAAFSVFFVSYSKGSSMLMSISFMTCASLIAYALFRNVSKIDA